MIPRAYIDRHIRWNSDQDNEQDLILNWIIVRLFKEMPGRLAIRGGTALYKLLVRPAPRFSEDIDLILTETDNIEEVSDIIQGIVNPCLSSPRIKPAKINPKTLIRSLTYTPENMKIKIEINIQDNFTKLGFCDIEFESRVNWIEGEWVDNSEKAIVKTYCLNEMVATKLHMLCEPGRLKGRDMFDVWYVLNYFWDDTDMEAILSCFRAHMKKRGNEVSSEKFMEMLEKKSREFGFKENINLLLHRESNIAWDFDAAKKYVCENIIARI